MLNRMSVEHLLRVDGKDPCSSAADKDHLGLLSVPSVAGKHLVPEVGDKHLSEPPDTPL